jgi:Fe-S-cluster containining protein
VPTIERVDTEIFRRTYYHDCMGCQFCGDSCCQYGCDVDEISEAALRANASVLEARVGLAATDWFRETRTIDSEFPGGSHTRTQVRNGRCLFLNRAGRGCHIHSHCLENGIDFHAWKPMVCCLFPVTFDGGTFLVSRELSESSLVCTGPGLTAYRSARADIGYYFGDPMLAELDALDAIHGPIGPELLSLGLPGEKASSHRAPTQGHAPAGPC